MTQARNQASTKKQGKTAAPTRALSKIGTVLPWVLVVAGIIGILASVMITVEKFDLIQNPSYHPACNLNPVISCGSVMQSKQANAFGFMNTYIGIVGFPVLLTVGMAWLAGARFKRWFWWGMQAGVTLGIAFAYWLLFESIFRIQALCPYCLSVDVVLTVTFWYVTLYNFYAGHLSLPRSLRTLGGFVKRHHLDLLILWFIIVIAVILKHFWYYYGQHI